MKNLNFNNTKKQYLNVTLADEKNTTLMIGTPTKAIMDDLLNLQESISAINEEETSNEIVEELYSACARVMSRNKGGIKIAPHFLEELFDIEDIIIFFNAYMEFLTEVTKGKN